MGLDNARFMLCTNNKTKRIHFTGKMVLSVWRCDMWKIRQLTFVAQIFYALIVRYV